VSTPSKPDEPGAGSSETAGGARTSTDEAAPETQRGGARPGDAESTTRVQAVENGAPGGSAPAETDGADGTSESSSGGGSAGPPPPWQRGGAAAGPPSGPVPTAGRPGAPRPSAPPTPAGGQPRPGGPGAHPPSGPFPRPGGPQGGGPQGGPGRPPGEGSGPPSGAVPVASRTAPVSGTSRPGGTTDTGGVSAGTSRSSGSGIDAPTNQLSPDQLGLRPREDQDETRREPDDVADLASARPRSGKAPRRASLQVRRFDPWSVLKLALVLGVALFFVWMFAVGVLYAVLDGMGVWAQLNGTYQDLTSDAGGGGELITAGGVFGVAAVVGVVNIILFTALASVSAFIYNISADVAGGIEVTLSERE